MSLSDPLKEEAVVVSLHELLLWLHLLPIGVRWQGEEFHQISGWGVTES